MVFEKRSFDARRDLSQNRHKSLFILGVENKTAFIPNDNIIDFMSNQSKPTLNILLSQTTVEPLFGGFATRTVSPLLEDAT